ncbi:flagellar hook-basal body complex protein FliE [Desulfuromonas acetoxidans]|uniref:Flagellar hook-basal body complex protein FliE n=1 Tax=Desulfuromonas acetoxidans (strain DSM 684 / 11070) TaxID=281689 RepID=Q1JZU0_DESA6|nr:flagellar hook-basal body complex protein FliE [Desulfuromonas acetoxidans]EAT15802.1 flagellar hook-basal body complex protein (FliE) [Desulfuromonas acetoxidans DSM 684]MBF0644996.1 flagellar hook-basal body complex protein FliE [Desulfuromonas acetoxidans]NVD25652.1 flagellar hook-basal body complex protein FliE [Desulfuromonas acetoxidans]NVE17705.1 flagellar hook-basal body complex protein FliE [Desulfuromonas acetoxidans]
MNDISIDTHLKSMMPKLSFDKETPQSGFADMLTEAIDQTNKAQLDADSAVTDLVTGKADNLHEVMLSMEEADVSMRMLVQIRNKVVDAYKEIIQMQV